MTTHVGGRGFRHYYNEPEKIICRFAPNGTGTPADQECRGCSVARTNTGKFTITLDRAYQALLDHKIDLRLATVANVFAKLSTYNATNKTLTLELFKLVAPGGGGDCTLTNVDVTYDANNVVSVEMTMGTSRRDT